MTRAAHAAAITTTNARSRNKRLAIPVASSLHLSGLPSDREAILGAVGLDDPLYAGLLLPC